MDVPDPPEPSRPEGSPEWPAETRIDLVRELAARFLGAQAREEQRRRTIARKRARRAIALAVVGVACGLLSVGLAEGRPRGSDVLLMIYVLNLLSLLFPIGIAALFLLDFNEN